jgi:hypothetical protein
MNFLFFSDFFVYAVHTMACGTPLAAAVSDERENSEKPAIDRPTIDSDPWGAKGRCAGIFRSAVSCAGRENYQYDHRA